MPDSQLLLHVGYHKAGSSHLQAWFHTHPDCVLAYAGFGVEQLINRAIASPATPTQVVVSSEEFSGGLTTPDDYLRLTWGQNSKAQLPANQKRICQWLKAVYPTARVLIVTRGFAGSLRSSYSQLVRTGGALSWEGYLKVYQQHLLDWLDMNYLIELYEQAFGAERVLVAPYEWLRRSPSDFHTWLQESLGLIAHPAPPGIVNPSLSSSALCAHRYLSGLVQGLFQILPEDQRLRATRSYAGWLLGGQLEGWTRSLDARRPSLIMDADFLEKFRGKSEILRARLLYRDYLEEYLLGEELK